MMCRSLCLLLLLVLASGHAFAQNEDLMKQDSLQQDTSKLEIIRQSPGEKTVSDSSNVTIESRKPVEPIVSYSDRFNPRKALLYAAVLPGGGQVYTKKYWKVPLVYGGFGFLVYAVKVSQDQYVLYKTDLFSVLNSPPSPTTTTTTPTATSPLGLSVTQLRSIVDQTRRQRDYYLILSFFWYILQMVDAHVDAHLKEFDLNPKLQVSIEPRGGNSMLGRNAGLALVFKF
jgi:Family of unknown function (DUF5683)